MLCVCTAALTAPDDAPHDQRQWHGGKDRCCNQTGPGCGLVTKHNFLGTQGAHSSNNFYPAPASQTACTSSPPPGARQRRKCPAAAAHQSMCDGGKSSSSRRGVKWPARAQPWVPALTAAQLACCTCECEPATTMSVQFSVCAVARAQLSPRRPAAPHACALPPAPRRAHRDRVADGPRIGVLAHALLGVGAGERQQAAFTFAWQFCSRARLLVVGPLQTYVDTDCGAAARARAAGTGLGPPGHELGLGDGGGGRTAG